MLKFVKRFGRDRRATIAMITAIFIFPLMFLGVGVPIDLARAIQYRAMLQNVADGAALAGSEALGIGATPAQACALTLAYINVPIENHEVPAATLSATLTAPGGGVSICNGAAGLSTPLTTLATAPNIVNVSISGSQPTTFLSIYKPSMPVSVSSAAIGPQGFITINIQPTSHYSGDLSQVYYYLRNSNGSLVNEDGTTVQPSSSGLLPGVTGGVSNAAFLGDDKWPTCNGPGGSACNTQTEVLVKAGLAQRLGFAYYVVSNGQGPCTAVYPKLTLNGALSDFHCLLNNQNYAAYNPYNPDTNIDNASNNAMNFFDYYQNNTAKNPATEIGKNPATEQPYLLLPNAYGSPVGWINAFFSTDYPASLNTNNYEASTNPNTNGNALSPTGGDACFTKYVAGSSTITTVSNGYAAASQSCIIKESSQTKNLALTAILDKDYQNTATVTPADGSGNPLAVAFWSSWSDANDGLQSINPKGSTYPAKTDLVCLVHDGGTANAAADTPTITNKGLYSVAANINADDQQENLLIANSTISANSSGPNVYRCPVDTVGNPYYPDPTCTELNGATLQIAWNDMGGILYDNGNYADLYYSYSCQPPAAADVINSAIIQ